MNGSIAFPISPVRVRAVFEQDTRDIRGSDHRRWPPCIRVVRWAIGDGAVLKKDRRRLWLMAKRGQTQRRITRFQIVRMLWISLQNPLKLVVHPIGCCRADIR